MPARSQWTYLDRKHDDERRFRLALGLSVLLHAALLLAWKLPPQPRKVADSAVLTVLLRVAAPRSQSATAAPQEHEFAVLTQKNPAPATFSAPPQAPVRAALVPPAAHPTPALPSTPARIAVQPTPGRPSNAAPALVGVTVQLIVGAEGRVEEIIWDQLPALTDAQLRRVEALIRTKTYAPRQTVNEVVDVRSLLKLAPVRTDDDPGVKPATNDG